MNKLTERENELWKDIAELIKAMQKIRFICDRSKSCCIEKSDIDEIIQITKKHV